MNHFVTTEWVTKVAVEALKNQLCMSRVVNRAYSSDYAIQTPAFDDVPTETGREAAKRLWRAAFGDDEPFKVGDTVNIRRP